MERPGPVTHWIVRHSRLFEAWRRLNWRATTEYAAGDPWQLSAALLRAIRDDCRTIGAELLVVRLPEKDAWRPATAMGDALARDSIAFLDMAALLPADPRALYYERDPHLRPRGHAWVAQAVAGALVARGWARPRH
jgi:hypothetical protein